LAKITAEYIWIDGQKPTAKLRSKTKIIDSVKSLSDIPEWGYDGSSTEQATGHFSDLLLRPVKMMPDPLHRDGDVLVLCEVLNPDGTVHPSNTRAFLREVAERYKEHDCWFGIEQEYTLFEGNRPLGWPASGFPAPQGGYYCGVGADEVFGRDLVEAHADACIRAGIHIVGTNAEVMPAQWEFQVGAVQAPDIADELWLARWLLYRIGEEFGISATLYPKPVKGDWNGAGAHTNFSTKETRAEGGIKVI
jgi:glutamine synthetase